jgi:hypothetical protein
MDTGVRERETIGLPHPYSTYHWYWAGLRVQFSEFLYAKSTRRAPHTTDQPRQRLMRRASHQVQRREQGFSPRVPLVGGLLPCVCGVALRGEPSVAARYPTRNSHGPPMRRADAASGPGLAMRTIFDAVMMTASVSATPTRARRANDLRLPASVVGGKQDRGGRGPPSAKVCWVHTREEERRRVPGPRRTRRTRHCRAAARAPRTAVCTPLCTGALAPFHIPRSPSPPLLLSASRLLLDASGAPLAATELLRTPRRRSVTAAHAAAPAAQPSSACTPPAPHLPERRRLPSL